MANPWELRRNNKSVSAEYYNWVPTNFNNYNSELCLCNWYPLRVLVNFGAANGLRMKLKYWPGRAPTQGGERKWNTARELVRDSHGGDFRAKADYARKVESTITARMIGTLNTVPIMHSQARVGDLLLRDYSDAYWHVELIVSISGTDVITEAGSTPKKVPKDYRKSYTTTDLAGGKKLYENKPRRWKFDDIFSNS